jgi:hypothetical protein
MTVRDHEVLQLLRDEPKLLAVADAVAVTQRRPRLAPGLLAIPAVALALLAVVLFAPWERSNPSFIDRALAAVGDDPVLHAVTRREEPAQWSFVNLATGKRTSRPLVVETELWYDGARGLAHTLERWNGKLAQDVLQTPEGVTSQEGTVYTCAWISRHPVEATRERVSCKLSGENGTVPRNVPEPPPIVDPALGGFITGYRKALEDGTARIVGDGELGGRPVRWLELRVPVPRPPGADQDLAPFEERVAVDRETYRPLVVRPLDGKSSYAYDVVTIETVTPDAADFSSPTPISPAWREKGGTVVAEDEITPGEADNVLGGSGLWVGPRFAGHELRSVKRQELRTTYDRSAGLPPTEGTGVEFTYGDPAQRNGSLSLMESNEPQLLYTWPSRRYPEGRYPTPPPGVLRLGPFDWGLLHRGGVYVTIMGADENAVIAAARALEPIPPE